MKDTQDKKNISVQDSPYDNTDVIPEAIALSYNPDAGHNAPHIVAKGQGYLAQRIIHTAESMNIPIKHNHDLIQLVHAAKIGDEIPVEAFLVVAEILRLIYSYHNHTTTTQTIR